jgi:hypothetical protein
MDSDEDGRHRPRRRLEDIDEEPDEEYLYESPSPSPTPSSSDSTASDLFADNRDLNLLEPPPLPVFPGHLLPTYNGDPQLNLEIFWKKCRWATVKTTSSDLIRPQLEDGQPNLIKQELVQLERTLREDRINGCNLRTIVYIQALENNQDLPITDTNSHARFIRGSYTVTRARPNQVGVHPSLFVAYNNYRHLFQNAGNREPHPCSFGDARSYNVRQDAVNERNHVKFQYRIYIKGYLEHLLYTGRNRVYRGITLQERKAVVKYIMDNSFTAIMDDEDDGEDDVNENVDAENNAGVEAAAAVIGAPAVRREPVCPSFYI